MRRTPAEALGTNISRMLISLHGSQRFRRGISWAVLVVGIGIWIGVQGALVAVPLWSRALFPEVDDSLTYVVKTRQMEECPFQDCLALKDLDEQFSTPSSDPEEVKAQRGLASSRVFPVYHPLLSAIFLGLKAFGPDLMTVYKLVWTVGPLIFGLAFAYLLSVLWGRTAAGLALAFLAFKVFPDTGLHYVVPSNIAMALAVILWGRIITRDGDAPWSMVLGSILLVGLHPVGRIYALMTAVIALFMPGFKFKASRCFAILGVIVVVALAFLSPYFVKIPGFRNPGLVLGGEGLLLGIVKGTLASMVEAVVQVRRLAPGLFVVFPIFSGAVLFGFLTLPRESRRLVLRLVVINWLFLFAILFYVSNHPADVVLRMWIPLVVILFGGVGRALGYCIKESWTWGVDRLKSPSEEVPVTFRKAWVLVVFAVLFGYAWLTMTSGSEQIAATIRYVRDREPLKFDPDQPAALLAEAKPGDRVLYTSIMIMPYYFIHGAMRLGAVYYHPAMKEAESVTKWLERPDLRFAAVYNPTVWHPSFEGVNETEWWIGYPNYAHSPLNDPQKPEPLSWEGELRSVDFRWIEIEPRVADFPRRIKLMIHNPGKPTRLELVPIDARGLPLAAGRLQETIQGKWTGPVELDLPKSADAVRFRIVFPRTDAPLRIRAIVFGDDKNHWPWAQKALMSFMPKTECTDPITVSFDTADLLPPPLRTRPIAVLKDDGSSVLLKIGR